MKIISWLKGKKKQRELRKLEPNKDFQFKEDYYGDTQILNGFKFIYCNNYTDKLYNSNKELLSFISCIISLPKTEKILVDLVNFINIFHTDEFIKEYNTFKINNISIEINESIINIYLRGNILYYIGICNNIHNNIITRYIRNNIFPNELPIETPNEFLDNIYNSINYPNKEIDILFIEDKVECKEFKPVIGLSININSDKIDINNDYINYKCYNNRYIIYCEINKLPKEELDYIINNVNHGNKLLELVHNNIEIDDIDSDIDEIIED